MIGYKIHYGEYDHDCWGKPEWCGWYEYDNVVYEDYCLAYYVMRDIQEHFSNYYFEKYEKENN